MASDVELVDRRRIVVAALPLPRRARARLARHLDGAHVVDIRDTVERADLVLAPSCSPQTVAALKDAYPDARLVIVELEDWELGIDLPGPVKRLFAAGADGYVTADSVAELATQLAPSADSDPADRADVASLPTASVDEVIVSTLAARLERERTAPARRRDDD